MVRDPGGGELVSEFSDEVPAATIASQRVAAVRDRPHSRLKLFESSYAPSQGAAPVHLRYRRAALAFMDWQLHRGLLNPPHDERAGQPVAEGGERTTPARRAFASLFIPVRHRRAPSRRGSALPVRLLRGRGTWRTTSPSSGRISTTATWPYARTEWNASSSTSSGSSAPCAGRSRHRFTPRPPRPLHSALRALQTLLF